MGRIGRVLSWAAGWLKFDRGGGDIRTARQAQPAGFHGVPLAQDRAVTVPLVRGLACVGLVSDTLPDCAAGEAAIFARSAGGIVALVVLRQTGGISITNEAGGEIIMQDNGEVTINGVLFDLAGNITAAKVTADEGVFPDSLLAGGAEVIGHNHICASPGSPSGPFPAAP